MNIRSAAILVGTLALIVGVGCDWDGLEENPQPNLSPSVRITGGAAEGRDADYRIEFFWFGSDPDGTVDHFVYAIDDTCLCTWEVPREIETRDGGRLMGAEELCSNDVEVCEAQDATFHYEHPDSVWKRIDSFSGQFNFAADDDPRDGDPPTSAEFHTFFIKAVDDRGAISKPDRRAFNAVTIAPTARLLRPVGDSADRVATVSTFVSLNWTGRDEDSVEADKRPTGYQMKLIPIENPLVIPDATVISYLTSQFSQVRQPNLLIPEEFVIPDGDPLPPPDPETGEQPYYHETDWWPKKDAPYEFEEYQLRNIAQGDYAFAIRPVDQAGAVMPGSEFAIADAGNDGNVVKLDVNPSIPVNPYLFVNEENLLGSFNFTARGQTWEVEVPVNVPLQFEWQSDATWYGSQNGNMNYALDIADPECEVCQSDDGVGGWIGWGLTNRFDVTFTEEQAGEQHVLYIRARDESDRPDREILGLIVMDVIAFSFDRTALWIDDFKVSGYTDCEHDDFLEPVLEYAVAPHLQLGEELNTFAAHSPTGPCQEATTPNEFLLSTMSRYRLLYWNVAAAGSGSTLGLVTNPSPISEFGRYLSIYMRAGGNVIVWGRGTIGALLGDFSPAGPYEPELPQFTNPNFGPGTFLWDVVRFRTKFDRVGRGTVSALSLRCSGWLALRPTANAIDLGYPVGVTDPYGLNDEDWTALWINQYSGRANPSGILGGVSTTGAAPLIVAGMDTLYTVVPNAWAWQEIEDPENPGEFIDGTEQACGSTFGSPFEDEPILIRYKNPVSAQGKFVWLGSQLYSFSDLEDGDQTVSRLMRGLTDWVFDAGP